MSNKTKATGAVILAGLLVASVVHAADGKRYTGAYCTFANSDNSSQDRYPPKFQNNSTTTQQVLCPILQESINGDIEYAEIVAHSTVDEDTCLLAERREDASWGVWGHDAVTVIAGGYNRTTWFPGSAWGNAVSGASFAIVCDLPASRAILSYRMDDR